MASKSELSSRILWNTLLKDTMASLDRKLEDHKDRQSLKNLVETPRHLKQLSDVEINLGNGQKKMVKVTDIEKKYEPTEGGQTLLNDGLLVLPAADCDYVKDKLKICSVEKIFFRNDI